jgi:hypothetical protein
VQGEGCVAHERLAATVHREVGCRQDVREVRWLCRRFRDLDSGRRGGRGTRYQGSFVKGPPRISNRYERFCPVFRHDDADIFIAGQGVQHGDDACSCRCVEVGQGFIH